MKDAMLRASSTTVRVVVMKNKDAPTSRSAARAVRARERVISDRGLRRDPRIGLIKSSIDDEAIVCRCERVTAAEIRGLIRQGYRDLNEIKVVIRAGLGACGSKTCSSLILRLFRDESIPLSEVTLGSRRPLFVEVPLRSFAGIDPRSDQSHE